MGLATVVPAQLPRESWCAAYVRAPGTSAVLVARDASASQWFTFSEPVEMATLSCWTWCLTRHGLEFMALDGLGFLCVLLVQGWRPDRPSPPVTDCLLIL
jgi:hypothetical protein